MTTTTSPNPLQVLGPACCPALLDAPIGQHEAESIAEVLKVLADPIRLRLVSLVATAPGGELCSCDLVDVLDRSQPTISHHLKVLWEAGILSRERRGSWVHYRVEVDRVRELTTLFAAAPA